MKAEDVLSLGLGLSSPWKLIGQTLDQTKHPNELLLEIRAERGALYPCPVCGKLCKAHDFQEMTWRHMDFFQHRCYLKARVPRVDCDEHGIHRAAVPWSRPESGFTALFDQMIMSLAREMPIKAIARHVGEHDTRIWRLVRRYVSRAMNLLNLSSLIGLGLDETACKRGHKYVTVFVDMDRESRPVIFATEGKGKQCLVEFSRFLRSHGGKPQNILEVVCDMSPAFLAASAEQFPNAAQTVDWFHVVQIFTRSVDEVRRAESRRVKMPKAGRWAVLKGWETQRTEEQKAALRELHERGLATATAFRVKEMLRWVREADTRRAARWRATHFLQAARELVVSDKLLEPVRKALQTFEEQLPRILWRWESLLSNARLEGLNGLFQAARSRARGYRNSANFIAMIYLIGAPIAELLNFPFPQ
jgi:transposase